MEIKTNTTADDFRQMNSGRDVELKSPAGEVMGGAMIVPHSHTAIDQTPYMQAAEAVLPAPRRRRGIFTAGTLESLLHWAEKNINGPIGVVPLPEDYTPPEGEDAVEREKRVSLLFFATGLETLATKWASPDLSLRTIGNYSDKEKAAWHDFGGEFKFPVSAEWARWAAGNKKPMDQKTFAAFIDDVAYELDWPEHYGQDGDETPTIAKRYLAAIEGKAAEPIDLIRLSRGLTVNIKKKVAESRNPLTGEGGIEIMAEHANERGERIAIPALFFIRVPIFLDTAPALIPVRLRYWIEEINDSAKTKWQYELLRPEDFVKDTFLAALAIVAARGHVALIGTPDMPTLPPTIKALVVNDSHEPRSAPCPSTPTA